MGGISQGLSGGVGGATAGSAFGPVGAGVGGGLGFLTGLFGGGPKTTSNTPSDLAGARSGQISTLNDLLKPGANLESFFGSFGNPTTDLQRQSTGGISQYLNQPSPETRALNTAMPSLQEMLTPGSSNPQFESDIAMGNQQGARFGSANAILRGEAYKNLFNSRNQAAQTLGMLSSNAGNADFGRLVQGYGVGTQQAGQNDIETQRRLGLLSGLMGMRQQLVGGAGTTTTPGLGQQVGQAGIGLAGLLQALGVGGNKGGGMPGTGAGNPLLGLFG